MGLLENVIAGAAGYFIPYKELPQNTGGRTDLILDASILHYTTSTDYEVLDRSKTYSFYLMDD